MTVFEEKPRPFVNPFVANSESGYEPKINDCLSVNDMKPRGFMSELPDAVLRRMPDPKMVFQPSGVDLGRRVIFCHDDDGDILDKEYDGAFEFLTERPIKMNFPAYAIPWLGGGKVVVAEAFGDLTSAEHDKAWINALNVAARFFGGAKPEQYNATDAKSVAFLAGLDTQPFRLLVRLANVYVSSYLSEREIIKRKSSWASGVLVENVNNPSRHGNLLESAAVNSCDVVWVPNDITEMRRAVSIMIAAAAPEYPYSDNAVLAACWPALNRPAVRYCARMDCHQYIEDYVFNSAEVMLVANMFCHHYGWTELWHEALNFVGFYSTRCSRFRSCLGQDKFSQYLPASDLRALGLGPMITARGGVYYEAPKKHQPEYLVVGGAVRRLCLATYEAAAVEAMGFQYAQLGLAESLIRSLSLRCQTYDSGSVIGMIAKKYGELSGWSDINDGVLMYRKVDCAASELIRITQWKRYPSWHFTSTFGLAYPEGCDADVMQSLARITNMELVSNEWHNIKNRDTTALKAVMALQMIKGEFMYEIRLPGRQLKHVKAEVSVELDGSYIPVLPLKAHKSGKKSDLLFRPKDAKDVLNWNVYSRKLNEANKFVLPHFKEYNLLDDWYGQFDMPEQVVADVLDGRRELLAMPSVPRIESILGKIGKHWPEVAEQLKNMANARGRDAGEDEVFGIAKFIVSSKFTQEDLLDRLKEMPMEDRAEAALAAAKISSLLRDCLENSQERILAIQSEELATHAYNALNRNPAMTLDEFREWGRKTDSVFAKAAWPKVPTDTEIRLALKNDEPIVGWLLRNNPHYDPKKAPSSTGAAKRVGQLIKEKQEAAQKRLREKIEKGKEMEKMDPEVKEQDFQSAITSAADPRPTTRDVPVEDTSTTGPQIEFGEPLLEDKKELGGSSSG